MRGRKFPDYEDPEIALGILLPLPGEVAFIHSKPYPTSGLTFRPAKIQRAPPIVKKKKKEDLDFGDIL